MNNEKRVMAINYLPSENTPYPVVIHSAETNRNQLTAIQKSPAPIFGTVISEDQRYRYVLERVLGIGPVIAFIGVNPSIADEHKDDPTIRRCCNFARKWGFGHLLMVNLFALRSPYPEKLLADSDPVGPDNNSWLSKVISKADRVIACWGVNGKYMGRDKTVCAMADKIFCFGVTKDGHPRHPLRLAANTAIEIFDSKLSKGK
ncbi:MAG: DUF1643 domain-containing protein [Acidobacteriota bacterium]